MLTPVHSVCLYAAEFLTPIASSGLQAANISLLPHTPSKPHTQQPAQQCWRTPVSGWGMQGCGPDPMEVLFCPACHRVAYSIPLMALKPPPSISADLATSGWASLGMATSPLLQLPPPPPPAQEYESHTMFSVSLSGPFLVEILTIYPCGYTDRLYQEIIFPSE